MKQFRKIQQERRGELGRPALIKNHFSIQDTEDGILIEQLLKGLPERNYRIMYLRFYYGYTEEEAGRFLKLSGQRIHQLTRQSIRIIYNDMRNFKYLRNIRF